MIEAPVHVSAYQTDKAILLHRQGDGRAYLISKGPWFASSVGPRLLVNVMRQVAVGSTPWVPGHVREIHATDPAFDEATRLARFVPAFVEVDEETPATFAYELKKAVWR